MMTCNSFDGNFIMPENMKKWMRTQNGVNISVNWNSASAISGYAHCLFKSVVISKLTRTCHRCGYDEIWAPEKWGCCQRHSYNAYRYDDVFIWHDVKHNISLENAFSEWEEKNRNEYEPIKEMIFGKDGFRN